jgi:hypothetical protein
MTTKKIIIVAAAIELFVIMTIVIHAIFYK